MLRANNMQLRLKVVQSGILWRNCYCCQRMTHLRYPLSTFFERSSMEFYLPQCLQLSILRLIPYLFIENKNLNKFKFSLIIWVTIPLSSMQRVVSLTDVPSSFGILLISHVDPLAQSKSPHLNVVAVAIVFSAVFSAAFSAVIIVFSAVSIVSFSVTVISSIMT